MHVHPDTLESYALGQVPQDGAITVEQHLQACDRCRRALISAERFISSMRAALMGVDWIIAVHRTADGPVLLGVGSRGDGWSARIFGCNVDSGERAGSFQAASSMCHSLFGQLFPEHVCSKRCRTEVRKWPM